MATLMRTLDVSAPATVAFTAWARMEGYPRFIEGVSRVEVLGPSRWRFSGDLGFGPESWEVGLLEAIPDLTVSWESTSVRHTALTVTCTALGLGRTRLLVSFSFDPRGVTEVRDPLRFMSARLDRSLSRYRDLVEGATESVPSPHP